jgi:hypothetical protein
MNDELLTKIRDKLKILDTGCWMLDIPASL